MLFFYDLLFVFPFLILILIYPNIIIDMYKLEIPAGTYAIFTPPEVQENDFAASINGTWIYILQQWFPNSQYEIDESKFDFEYYYKHCHPWEYEKVSMKIYIPIKSI